MDVIEKFVNLSIRTGSSLDDLAKQPENLNCVLSVFRACCDCSTKPTKAEAEAFLAAAGSWLSVTADKLAQDSLKLTAPLQAKISLVNLTKRVDKRRREIREERRRRALEMEEVKRASRVDTSRDVEFMSEALAEAHKAMLEGEVPVGAVVVDPQGKIVGRGHNRVISDKDPSAHAEILALRDAARTTENYRLEDCSLYVTLEPCPMCSGAIIGARLSRLIYGAKDDKAGAVDSVVKLFKIDQLNHHTRVTGGVLQDQSLQLLRDFFARLRQILGRKCE